MIVVTATYRRPDGLADLLASLRSEGSEVIGVVVVDNAGSADTSVIVSRSPLPVHVITPGRNLGCGGGVALGLREALRDPTVTHVAVFDDDAKAAPGVFRAMLDALQTSAADAVTPLILNHAGYIGWFPGPLMQPAWSLVREENVTPNQFRQACGNEPLDWVWSPWPSLLVTRRAVETVGFPRDDFWFQGEDIEWTTRISARFRAVLAPAAEAWHLPPIGNSGNSFLKAAAMLQNNAFTASRLAHGRRLLHTIPGNAWRFLRGHRFAGRAWSAAARAHWNGLVLGRPAGVAGADQFRLAWVRGLQSKREN